jgi:signal transduction histidine kinase
MSRYLRLPRRTVRLRLTLLYGGLFLVCSCGLMAITYLLVDQGSSGAYTYTYTTSNGTIITAGCSARVRPGATAAHAAPAAPRSAGGQCHAMALQHAHEMQLLLAYSGVALAIMAVAAFTLGWLVAGRVVLRPLRTMTLATQRITERNLHERLALTGPDDELKRLADTIDDLLGRLEWAFDAQRRFVANASHELRTPLTMMRTALDVAAGKPGPQPPQVTVLAAKVRKGLDRAERLLEGLLLLARARHVAAADGTVVWIGQAAKAALAERGEAIEGLGLTVEQALADVPVQGSEVLLARMAENVIDNAVRHNQPGGWIRVTTATGGPLARLTVETGGRVLDQREVSGLGQPFRRLGAERTGSDAGTGLGLSIVAAVAAAHDGTLDLQARAEGGLRVTITLPLADHAAVAAIAAMAGAPA